MEMGKKRLNNKHLPKRVYIPKGKASYYYVDKAGKYHRIAKVKEIGNELWKLNKWIHDNIDSRVTYSKSNSTKSFITFGSDPTSGTYEDTMNNLFDEFEKKHIPTLSKSSKRSYPIYLRALRVFFGKMKPSTVEKIHVYKFLTVREETKSASTANHEFTVLSSVFSKGISYGLVRENPCLGIKKIPIHNPVKHVSDEVYLAVYSQQNEMMQCAMDIYLLCGRRRQELLRITKSDLTEKGIRFKLDKKKAETHKTIEWSPALRKVVDRAISLHPHPFVQALICNSKGDAYTGDGFRANFERGVKRAISKGLITPEQKFTIKSLRAKSSIESESLQAASELLGHSELKVTDKHYRTNESTSKPLR